MNKVEKIFIVKGKEKNSAVNNNTFNNQEKVCFYCTFFDACFRTIQEKREYKNQIACISYMEDD